MCLCGFAGMNHAAQDADVHITPQIEVDDPDYRESGRTYTFDATFGAKTLQRHVYDTCASSIVDSAIDGM